ncbi:MAG TPA: hypothetical protein VF074_03910 [Pyrinomonadaceae bacterium]
MAVKTKSKRSRTSKTKTKKKAGGEGAGGGGNGGDPSCPWMKLDPPPLRTLKVYALDPSAGNYVGNVMSVKIKWEDDLKPGPIGSKIAVVDYDGANRCYYPPVDLNDPTILARGGLDPSESDPRFHQQMVYAVASETIERFEAALGRRIRWRRADRPRGFDQKTQTTDGEGGSWRKTKDIWTLNLFPHAMVKANAFYSPEAKGILFGYFQAEETNQGRNLPGQRVFTCLSHDIIAHEVTHAIIDGIRTYFTEPTNPDVLAFHEAFSDLAALFSHFSHKEALLDTIQKTGGELYQYELKPDTAPTSANGSKKDGDTATLYSQLPTRNPLTDLAQQFGEASGMNRGLRSALDRRPNANDINTRVSDVHFRGSILVAAVFDAYFSIYMKRTGDLFRVYRAGRATNQLDDLPGPLARLLAEQASATAAEFFQLCARALDYCPPVDITFGDFLRALITAHIDLTADEGYEVRDALMQAFRVRGIYSESAAFFSQDSLCWPKVPEWTNPPADGALPPVEVELEDPVTKEKKMTTLVFGDPNGLTREEKDINGRVLREYAEKYAERLGFNNDPSLPLEFKPYAPSFHPVFRLGQDGSLRTDMVVELVQTQRVPFDENMPLAGSFPFRAGVTLIISAPEVNNFGKRGKPIVRFAIGKPMKGDAANARKQQQRVHSLAMGLAEGNTEDPNHFQVDFGLLHEGL